MKPTSVQLNSLEFIASTSPETAPAIVALIPPGPAIVGRDGRSYKMSDPQTVVNNFIANSADIPIDIEHASEIKAPQGEYAGAVGWIKSVFVDASGGISANVEWTPYGNSIITGKEYRYLSPAFTVDKKTSEIIRLTSVGLVNQPNLLIPALNREDINEQDKEKNSMDELMKKLAKALDLEEGADDTAIQAEIKKLKKAACESAKNTADIEAALNRATTSEGKLAELETELNRIKAEAHQAEVNRELEKAAASGKLTPAQKEWATTYATADLNGFRDFIAHAPVVVPVGESRTTQINTNSSDDHVAEGLRIANAFKR